MLKRKTKIICTIGPAVRSRSELQALAEAGMNVARLNFSHGKHKEFADIIKNIREIEQEISRPIGILADIQGPKIRVGKLKGGQMEIHSGEEVWIQYSLEEGGELEGKKVIPTVYREFCNDVGTGNRILLDDGLMEVRVVGKDANGLRCNVVDGGVVKDNKGINVPGVAFSAHAITEKDYSDILFCTEQGVDFVALSFVRSSQEVRHLKSFLESREKDIQVIAKIEKEEALINLEDIINESDGILIARGDLAVEVGNERVPVLQKQIVRKCNLQAKTVIIATQMLMSMVESPRPSRAEASDVANAIVDGTDAVMLSNETAVGKYPIEAVKMMSKIVEEMEYEQRDARQSILFDEWEVDEGRFNEVALLQSAVRLAAILNARAVVNITQSGRSALLVSKCRPKNLVIAITGSLTIYRQLTLKWGVLPLYMQDMENLITQTAVFEAIGQRLLALNLCQSSDKIVVTAGLPRLKRGSTNTIKVHSV